MVRAVVPSGKNVGTHTGRVTVRATGSLIFQQPRASFKSSMQVLHTYSKAGWLQLCLVFHRCLMSRWI
jgi:hypothetical protein